MFCKERCLQQEARKGKTINRRGLRVSEYLDSPFVTKNNHSVDQDVGSPGPSRAKSPRVESSILESLRTSLKDEITSELKSFLANSQKEIFRLLKAETNTNVREEPDEDTENETRSFYTFTMSVRINSTQNKDPCSSRSTGCSLVS